MPYVQGTKLVTNPVTGADTHENGLSTGNCRMRYCRRASRFLGSLALAQQVRQQFVQAVFQLIPDILGVMNLMCACETPPQHSGQWRERRRRSKTARAQG